MVGGIRLSDPASYVTQSRHKVNRFLKILIHTNVALAVCQDEADRESARKYPKADGTTAQACLNPIPRRQPLGDNASLNEPFCCREREYQNWITCLFHLGSTWFE